MIDELANEIIFAEKLYQQSKSAQARKCFKEYISLTIKQIRALERLGGSDETQAKSNESNLEQNKIRY